MANVKLDDLIALYRTPAKTEDPAIESGAALKRIMKAAGGAFPKVKTTGWLTHIALPEKDGDLHFYIETEKGSHDAGMPMMACEIQGLFKNGSKTTNDPRLAKFKLLMATQVEVVGLLRCWPEHLRASTQPHFFELHPVLSIGAVGKTPIDFADRVVWPTGEDPNETARTFNAIADPPAHLTISAAGGRIVFATPSHGMMRENYVHLDGFYRGGAKKVTSGLVFDLFEKQAGTRSVGMKRLRNSRRAGLPALLKRL